MTQALPNVTPLDDDMRREQRINRYFRRMVAAELKPEQRQWWAKMQAEILSRSPEQVARLERARGLR